jgi:hypothetical protein
MKKLLILLSCVGLIAISGCRNKREDERRRLEIERIRQDQEAARLADEQKLLELQLRARTDSSLTAKPVRASRNYYVVIGSFRVAGNAYSYSAATQPTFGNVSVVPRRGWYYVTVGGVFGSRAAAVQKMHEVLSTAVYNSSAVTTETDYSSDEEDEEYVDEEDIETEEIEVDADAEVDDEYVEEDEDYEEDYEEDTGDYSESSVSTTMGGGFSGQAWVMAL